jgi:hypothetical protein
VEHDLPGSDMDTREALPPGCFEVDLDDGRKALSVMSPVSLGQASSRYWFAQLVCAQLNAYASRCPRAHSRGLEHLYFRTVGSVLQKDACSLHHGFRDG